MRIVLVRSRTADPSVFKYANSLHLKGKHDVSMILWERGGHRVSPDESPTTRMDILKLDTPQDRMAAVVFLPIWWIYETIMLMRSKRDIIHCCDLDTLMPGILVRLIFKIPLYYTVFDFYSSNIPQAVPSPLRAAIGALERKGIGLVDELFLVDECRREQIGLNDSQKATIIYNTPRDTGTIEVNRTGNNRPRFTIFYGGLVHESRGIEQLIHAVSNLEDVKFVIAGTGPLETRVRNLISKLPYSNVEYVGFIPHSEILLRTHQADLCVALYDPSIANSRFASPNKLFESMMCGKPIIVNSGTAAATIVTEEECGILVEYGNVESLRAAIVAVRNDREMALRMGRNGRIAHDERYSWDIMEHRLAAVYESYVRGKKDDHPRGGCS